MKKILDLPLITNILNGLNKRNMDLYEDPDYKLDSFSIGYARYFGCGNHLYLLTNQEASQEMLDICDIHGVHPRNIAAKLTGEFRLVMLDVEMGGMSVYFKII